MAGGGVDEFPVPDVNAHVADGIGAGSDEENQVTGLQLVLFHVHALPVLGGGSALDLLAALEVAVVYEAGAVEPVGGGAAIDIGDAQVLFGDGNDGFGQAVRAVGEDGYDLVDLGDLISRFGKEDGELRQALQDTVVVSRSNREGAGGLSVYHPFVNKRKYLESWRDDYRALEFSDGYARYLERFGAMLTGEELVDWSNLSTLDLGTDAEGNHVFSLQLSEEQREEMASVQLMIIEKVSDYGSGSFAPISVETAGMDANGQVSAKYRGRALYVLDENGNTLTGPISFQLSEDGEYYIVLTTDADELEKRIRKRGDIDMINRALFLKEELEAMPENQGHLYNNTGKKTEEIIREIVLEQYLVE